MAVSRRSLPKRLWYDFLRIPLHLTAVVGFGVRHTGTHNIPSEGGVLVVSNHQSHFDPPLVGLGCPRRMNYLARDTLFEFAPLRWVIQSLDAIPIYRDGLGLDGIKAALRRLKHDELVLIFPEGRRCDDGEIASFRPGFTTLAKRTRSAILPVAIDGAFAAWPRLRRFPRPATIHVRYGPPLLPEQVARYDERELLLEVERRVRQCQAELRRHPDFARRRP
jgi:1-acyl-sn-glycerol-3-phosphate acyltransferase